MWPDRRLIERLDIVHPIIQAPMAGASTAELVAAVSNAGGMGWLGAAMMTPDAIRAGIAEIRRLTKRPFGVNLFAYTVPEADAARQKRMKARVDEYVRAMGVDPEGIPAAPPLPDMAQQTAVVLEAAPPAFSFTFGMPSRAVIAAFKAKGTFVAGTATTVAEAHALSEAGVDGIVAQGFEAGGHRGTFLAPVADSVVGTLALVPMIVDAVKLPVIAAGGIMDGRGIAAVFALGAAAAALGTAFIPCPENTVVTRLHREALLGDQSQPTTLSRAYTGRYARFLKNRYIDEMTRVDDDIPAYPHTIPITGSLRKVALERNDADFAHIMAGQAYPLCRSLPAGQLLQTLVRETGDVLAALRGLNVDLTQRA